MKKINIIVIFAFIFSVLGMGAGRMEAWATAGGCGFNTAGDYTCQGDSLNLPNNPGMPNIPGYGGPAAQDIQIPPQDPYTPGDLTPGMILPWIPIIPTFLLPLFPPIPTVTVIPRIFCNPTYNTNANNPINPTDPGKPTPGPTGGCMDYLNELGNKRECRTNNPAGRWDCVNQHGFLGRYQMGAEALIDAGYAKPGSTNSNIMWTGKDGVWSRQDFLNNHQAQNNAINAFNNKNWGYIKNLQANGRSLASYEGETVCGVKLTKGAMIAAAHGHGVGNLQKFIKNCHIHRDGNGVPITHTMNQFQNFDMSSCIK